MDQAKRVSEIRAKASQLLARAAKLEGLTKAAERKRRTRRAVLIGLMVLARVEKGQPIPPLESWEDVQSAMNNFLQSSRDRAVFDFSIRGR